MEVRIAPLPPRLPIWVSSRIAATTSSWPRRWALSIRRPATRCGTPCPARSGWCSGAPSPRSWGWPRGYSWYGGSMPACTGPRPARSAPMRSSAGACSFANENRLRALMSAEASERRRLHLFWRWRRQHRLGPGVPQSRRALESADLLLHRRKPATFVDHARRRPARSACPRQGSSPGVPSSTRRWHGSRGRPAARRGEGTARDRPGPNKGPRADRGDALPRYGRHGGGTISAGLRHCKQKRKPSWRQRGCPWRASPLRWLPGAG